MNAGPQPLVAILDQRVIDNNLPKERDNRRIPTRPAFATAYELAPVPFATAYTDATRTTWPPATWPLSE